MKGLCIFVALLASVASDCPKGFTLHDDFCYTLVTVKASWAEAVVYCQAVGAQLVRVETAKQHQFFKTWLTQNASTMVTGGVWLAGQDFLVEGEWQWAFSGDKIGQTWWLPGRPDNVNGPVGQDCLSMWKTDQFLWDDDQCSDQLYFLCETEAPTSPVIG